MPYLTPHTPAIDPLFTRPLAARAFDEAGRECHRLCSDTAQHCQATGGELSEARVLRSLRECARACKTSLASLAIGSHLTRPLLFACRAACAESALLCTVLARGASDQQLVACAESCHDCVATCEALIDELWPAERAASAA